MKVFATRFLLSLAVVFFGTSLIVTERASAQSVSIAVLDMQKVVLNSEQGKAAKKDMESKFKELEKKFKKEEDALAALQNEIEKKSSVWSEEKKQDKAIEFQKMRRDLRVKQDDANLELKQLQEKKLAPIFEELEKVVKNFAKEKGYAIILPGQAVLYAVESVDITEDVTKALNSMAK